MASEIVQQDCNTGGDTAELRFVSWCDQQRHLSALRAMERFGLHKATAYRWINAYRAARGMHA